MYVVWNFAVPELFCNTVFQSTMPLSAYDVNGSLASYKASFNLHLSLPTNCL